MSCSCKIGGGPNGVCLECRRAANFNARLKRLESSREDAIAEGRRLEREAIVADLRARAAAYVKGEHRIGNYVEGLADRYENGEHAKEGT